MDLIQPNALIGFPIRNDQNNHTNPRITMQSTMFIKNIACRIRVRVKLTTRSKTQETSQICESHPSPRTYATKSVDLIPKTTTPPLIYGSTIWGMYRIAKTISNPINIAIALSRVLSLVRFAIYMLRIIPETIGNHNTLDNSAQNSSYIIRLLGFATGAIGFVIYGITMNRFLAAFAFGLAASLLFLALICEK